MTTSPVTNFFLISSLVFLMIAVVGKSKFGFAEINPGGFGRLLALLLGTFSLLIAAVLVLFPIEMLEVLKSSLAEQIQQNMDSLIQFKLPIKSS